MEYQIEKLDDILLLTLTGRLLGEHQTLPLLEELEEQIALGYVHMAIDLHGLDYINSNGLNFLLTLLTKSRKKDGEVLLCCLSEKIQDILISTKLKAFFSVAEDRQSAIDHFRQEQATS